jgi:hypothetical protein
MVPAHGVTTIYHLLEKTRDRVFAREGVERLIAVFEVAPVDDNVVRRALGPVRGLRAESVERLIV